MNKYLVSYKYKISDDERITTKVFTATQLESIQSRVPNAHSNLEVVFMYKL